MSILELKGAVSKFSKQTKFQLIADGTILHVNKTLDDFGITEQTLVRMSYSSS
jgi:hypothetical protein